MTSNFNNDFPHFYLASIHDQWSHDGGRPPGRTHRAVVGVRVDHEPRHFAILVVDAESSSQVDGADQPRFRSALRHALTQALRSSGLDWDSAHHAEASGDSWLFVFDVNQAHHLIGPVVSNLDRRLESHNRQHLPRIRLRVAVQQGVVHLPDVPGQPLRGGTALNEVHRLLDATELKNALKNSRSNTALIVSDDIYRTLVRDRYVDDMSPESFGRVEVAVKDYHALAWIYVPGYHEPPIHTPAPAESQMEATRPDTDQQAPLAAPQVTVGNTGYVVNGGQVVNGGNLVNGPVHGGFHAPVTNNWPRPTQ